MCKDRMKLPRPKELGRYAESLAGPGLSPRRRVMTGHGSNRAISTLHGERNWELILVPNSTPPKLVVDHFKTIFWPWMKRPPEEIWIATVILVSHLQLTAGRARGLPSTGAPLWRPPGGSQWQTDNNMAPMERMRSFSPECSNGVFRAVGCKYRYESIDASQHRHGGPFFLSAKVNRYSMRSRSPNATVTEAQIHLHRLGLPDAFLQ